MCEDLVVVDVVDGRCSEVSEVWLLGIESFFFGTTVWTASLIDLLHAPN